MTGVTWTTEGVGPETFDNPARIRNAERNAP
jgi:hypothetical protein